MEEYIEELRQRLLDYYGTAMYSGFPMAMMDVIDVSTMSDEEVIEKARELGVE